MSDSFDELDALARKIDRQRDKQNKLSAEQNKIKEKYLDLIQNTLREFALRVWTIRYKQWDSEGLDPLTEAARESDESLKKVDCNEDGILMPGYWWVDQESKEKYSAGYEFERYFILLELDSSQIFTGRCVIGIYGYGGWKANIKLVSKLLLGSGDDPTFIVDEVIANVNKDEIKRALVKLYKTHGDSKL